MQTSFILAIDQGTTSSTVLVISKEATVLGKASIELPQHFPQEGWVEHDPQAIWSSVINAIPLAMKNANVDAKDCLCIGITNQRETTVLWNKETHLPLHHAIVWQDRRTANRCAQLKEESLETLVREKTGLVIDAYFSATKLEWLLNHAGNLSPDEKENKLAFGTIDSFLLFKLTAGKKHQTDISNASRTMLFNIHTCKWDDELLALFGIPKAILPEVRSCSEVYGHTQNVPGLPDGIPISGMAGDQQAALFGQTCFRESEAKCTYGTGAFLLVNTGPKAVEASHGILTTVAWKIGDQVTYALEGSSFIAGAAVQWLRDGLGLIKRASDIEDLARAAPDSSRVIFVPALTGLGAPHWQPHARGLIVGLGRDTTVNHIARATLEGIAFQIYDLVQAMVQCTNKDLASLRVDGGASANNLMMQFQADVLEKKILRPYVRETTALGAAYLAGLSVGVFENLNQIQINQQFEKIFEPKMQKDRRQAAIKGWQTAVTLANTQAYETRRN